MKNKNLNFLMAGIVLLATGLQLSCSSSKWIVPSDYAGQWQADKVRITVRTKAKGEPFKFTSDTATVKLVIQADRTASGSIGTAVFEKSVLKKNPSLPWETGVEYIVICGSIGKIFANDPLEAKEVELWLSPINDKGRMHAGLRYTEGIAQFPMAGMTLKKMPE